MQKFLLAIALVVFVGCSSGCRRFKWTAKPWSGDSKHQQLVNPEDVKIKCDQPAFDKMTCFDADNMAELKTAIDRVKMSKLDRIKVNKLFRSLRLF